MSVCVPAYNHEAYVEQAVVSALRQLGPGAVEVLVGDDGSHDGTWPVLERLMVEYPDQVRAFRHQPNIGASPNYQFLVSRARGAFIAHLDGDDYWLPGKLVAQLEFLDRYPQCVAVYTGASRIDATSGANLGTFSTRQVPEVFDLDTLLSSVNFLNHSSLLYRAPLARRVVLDIQETFIDFRLHLRFASRGELGYLPREFVGYRVATPSSQIRTMPNAVFEWYWQALTDPWLDGHRNWAWRQGAACWLCGMLKVAAQHRDRQHAVRWARRILKESGSAWPDVLRRASGIAARRMGTEVLRFLKSGFRSSHA